MKPDEMEFADGKVFQRYYFENGLGASIIKEIHRIHSWKSDKIITKGGYDLIDHVRISIEFELMPIRWWNDKDGIEWEGTSIKGITCDVIPGLNRSEYAEILEKIKNMPRRGEQ